MKCSESGLKTRKGQGWEEERADRCECRVVLPMLVLGGSEWARLPGEMPMPDASGESRNQESESRAWA